MDTEVPASSAAANSALEGQQVCYFLRIHYKIASGVNAEHIVYCFIRQC